MSPVVLAQLEALKTRHPDAGWEELLDGVIRVVVPSTPIPSGWSTATVSVHFVLPVGFPVATPDCFWTDADLRLADGQMPQNTGNTPMPGATEPLLWFSWHTQAWDSASRVSHWLRAIMQRFEAAR